MDERILIDIATTGGPATIRAAEYDEEALRSSMVLFDRNYVTAGVDEHFDACDRKLRRQLAKLGAPTPEGGLILEVDEMIDAGESWQLGLTVLHLALASGRLATSEEAATRVIWATGAVRTSSWTARPVEAVPLKLERSAARIAALLARGLPVDVLVPSDQQGEAAAALPAGVTLHPVHEIAELLPLLGIVPAAEPSAGAPPAQADRNRARSAAAAPVRDKARGSGMRRAALAGAGLLCLGGLAVFVWGPERGPSERTEPPPASDSSGIENTRTAEGGADRTVLALRTSDPDAADNEARPDTSNDAERPPRREGSPPPDLPEPDTRTAAPAPLDTAPARRDGRARRASYRDILLPGLTASLLRPPPRSGRTPKSAAWVAAPVPQAPPEPLSLSVTPSPSLPASLAQEPAQTSRALAAFARSAVPLGTPTPQHRVAPAPTAASRVAAVAVSVGIAPQTPKAPQPGDRGPAPALALAPFSPFLAESTASGAAAASLAPPTAPPPPDQPGRTPRAAAAARSIPPPSATEWQLAGTENRAETDAGTGPQTNAVARSLPDPVATPAEPPAPPDTAGVTERSIWGAGVALPPVQARLLRAAGGLDCEFSRMAGYQMAGEPLPLNGIEIEIGVVPRLCAFELRATMPGVVIGHELRPGITRGLRVIPGFGATGLTVEFAPQRFRGPATMELFVRPAGAAPVRLSIRFVSQATGPRGGASGQGTGTPSVNWRREGGGGPIPGPAPRTGPIDPFNQIEGGWRLPFGGPAEPAR